MSWADDLRIPELVEDCLHMVAAHEIRNSFPVDSLLQGLRYPRNCRERVYPGAHSDVGGGYRRGGEGRTASAEGALADVKALERPSLSFHVFWRTPTPRAAAGGHFAAWSMAVGIDVAA